MRLTLMFVLVWAAALAAQSKPTALPPTRSIWDGVYTFEQADRGKMLYVRQCAECHMPDLQGKQPPPTIVALEPPGSYGVRYAPGASPALVGVKFMANWSDLRLNDLYERTRVSMPQQAPGSLSRQQNADIAAYVLNVNGYPAGLAELPSTKVMLDDIRIDK